MRHLSRAAAAIDMSDPEDTRRHLQETKEMNRRRLANTAMVAYGRHHSPVVRFIMTPELRPLPLDEEVPVSQEGRDVGQVEKTHHRYQTIYEDNFPVLLIQYREDRFYYVPGARVILEPEEVEG